MRKILVLVFLLTISSAVAQEKPSPEKVDPEKLQLLYSNYLLKKRLMEVEYEEVVKKINELKVLVDKLPPKEEKSTVKATPK